MGSQVETWITGLFILRVMDITYTLNIRLLGKQDPDNVKDIVLE